MVVVAAALWGCIGLFTKTMNSAGFTSIQIVSIRVTVAALIYIGYLMIRDPQKLKIKFRDIIYFIGTGIVSLVFFSWCYFGAIEESSMATAAVLLYTSPIFVSLFSALIFKERMTWVKSVALAAAFLGCVLVTGAFKSGGALTLKAVLLGLGSGIGYALYSIFGKLAMRKYSPETVTAYTFITGSLASLPLAFWKGVSVDQGDIPTSILCALALGAVCCVLPYVLYTRGLMEIQAGKAAILATCEPVVATVLGAVVFKESLEPLQVAGMVLVLGAAVLLGYGSAGKIKKIRRGT